jgi:CRP-like cAMP-binding protein
MSDNQGIDDLINDLNEKNKELNCLYKVDDILSSYEQSLDDTFRWLTKVIPMGWRYTDLCKVKISCNGLEISSEDFKSTELKLQQDIIIEGEIIGYIHVVYIKPVHAEKGIFLPKELKLLSTISQKISSYMLYFRLRNTIRELQEKSTIHAKTDNDTKVRNWLKQQHLMESDINKMLQLKIQFKKGETICKQGALASYIILLTEGLSKNYLEGNHEKGFNFKIIKPFDFIGLSSLYGKNIYGFSGSALTNCEAFMVDVNTFKNIISTNHQFATRVMNWYCNVTHTHLKRLSSIANKQSLGRLAETLLYLNDEIFNAPILTNIVSRKDIAELAAISTEAAVRFLSDLKKDKIIEIHPNRIEILNRKTLEMIVAAG